MNAARRKLIAAFSALISWSDTNGLFAWYSQQALFGMRFNCAPVAIHHLYRLIVDDVHQNTEIGNPHVELRIEVEILRYLDETKYRVKPGRNAYQTEVACQIRVYHDESIFPHCIRGVLAIRFKDHLRTGDNDRTIQGVSTGPHNSLHDSV